MICLANVTGRGIYCKLLYCPILRTFTDREVKPHQWHLVDKRQLTFLGIIARVISDHSKREGISRPPSEIAYTGNGRRNPSSHTLRAVQAAKDNALQGASDRLVLKPELAGPSDAVVLPQTSGTSPAAPTPKLQAQPGLYRQHVIIQERCVDTEP